MAILEALKKNKEKEEKENVEDVDSAKVNTLKQKVTTLQNVLKYPRITEKAAILAESNAYTFEIDPRANKIEVARAIKQIYNVEPLKVNIIKLPARKVVVRGKRGTKSGVKKAIVFLKKGDKIELV